MLPKGPAVYECEFDSVYNNNVLWHSAVMEDKVAFGDGAIAHVRTCSDLLEHLGSLEPLHLKKFILHRKGSRYIQEIISANPQYKCHFAALVVSYVDVFHELLKCQAGSYVTQNVTPTIHDGLAICEKWSSAILPRMFELTTDKYACRIVQTACGNFHPDLVKRMLRGLHGREATTAMDKHGHHALLVVLSCQPYFVYEKFFTKLVEPSTLRHVVSDRNGCIVIQECLEALVKQVNSSFVPELLNRMVLLLLEDAAILCRNEFANYVIQYILQHPLFASQRNYVIEHVVLGNVAPLALDKYSSHVVELAIVTATPEHLRKIFTEAFDKKEVDHRGRNNFELMLFDHFGNYVVQRMVDTSILVARGERPGDPLWLDYICSVVRRHKSHLQNYSSGKKIIERLCIERPELMGMKVPPSE